MTSDVFLSSITFQSLPLHMPFSLFHSYHCKYACVIMILMHLCMNIMHENYDNQCISFIFHIIFQSMYEIQTNNNDEQNTSTKKIDLLVSISSPTSTIQRSFLLMLLISCTANNQKMKMTQKEESTFIITLQSKALPLSYTDMVESAPRIERGTIR